MQLRNGFLLITAFVFAAACAGNDEKKGNDVAVAAAQHNQLSEQEKADGWQLLFDGTTATGWRAFNGNSFPGGWVVDSGTLKSYGTAHGDTGGDIVYGLDSFTHFELSVDWKISTGGNSGIFYHAQEGKQYKAPYETAPEYQLIDDLNFPQPLEDWQKLAADYAMYTADTNKLIKPAGEWNNASIYFTADSAAYFLNGAMTLHFVPWSSDWNIRRNSGKWDAFPDYGKFKTGMIALQDHGSEIWFRNIKIRKLP